MAANRGGTPLEHLRVLPPVEPVHILQSGGNGMHHGRFLPPGDVIEREITGLGIQRNRCVSASA